MNTVRTMVGGRYRLDEVLGRGGMSTVYRATDAVLGRTVAIKVLSPALANGDSVWVARFEREARAAAGLTHPGVATVYDTGVEGDTRFIVMECVPGQSLAAVLQERAPLDTRLAANIGAHVADVLATAHAAGIIHRDVKPGNVMVMPDGTVKVLDFGIARATDSTAITQTVSVLGTAAYMAPEQASGQLADARSDIYSLGCLLYAMLAGSPPFAGDQAAAVLHQHVNVGPRPLRDVAPGVPPALAALVEQMLAKSPDARPQSAAEVRDRLRSVLDPTAPTIALRAAAAGAGAGAGIAAGAAGAAGAAVPRRPIGAPTARTRRMDRPRRSSTAGRGLALAAVLGLALLLAVIAIASSGGGRSADNSISSTTQHTTTQNAPTTSSSSTTTPKAKATPPAKPAKPPKPPGHGGQPPGQAKKHGGDNGNGNGGGGGDGGDGG